MNDEDVGEYKTTTAHVDQDEYAADLKASPVKKSRRMTDWGLSPISSPLQRNKSLNSSNASMTSSRAPLAKTAIKVNRMDTSVDSSHNSFSKSPAKGRKRKSKAAKAKGGVEGDFDFDENAGNIAANKSTGSSAKKAKTATKKAAPKAAKGGKKAAAATTAGKRSSRSR